MQEYFDVLNEYGEFTNKVATREECHEKVYGIEQYMDLYSIKREMFYFKREVQIKNYGQIYGTLLQVDMF